MYINPHKFFRYYVENSYLHEIWNFDWNKSIAEKNGKFVVTTDPIMWFIFQYSLVLIPKRKRLVGGSQISCWESGTPLTIIYIQWSSLHEWLEYHTSMVYTQKIYNKYAHKYTCKRRGWGGGVGGECAKVNATKQMRSKYCFRWYLGVVRHQARTWFNVDPDPSRRVTHSPTLG